MANQELKVGDTVKAGFRKGAGIPRQYVEGVIVAFSVTKVTIKYLDNNEEVLGVVAKSQCTLIEAA